MSKALIERVEKMREEMLAEQINGWPNTVSDILSTLSSQEEEIEGLRTPFRHADETDWKYINELLSGIHRERQSAQAGFWIAVLAQVRRALEGSKR